MRTKLFVPGSRPELFDKAMLSEADAVSIDLQDAVDESRKGEARAATARFLASLPSVRAKVIIVRVNALGSAHFAADVAALGSGRPDMINVPLIESAEDIRRAAALLDGLPILANIETPKGLRCAAEIAAADPSVVGLQMGYGDLLEPLGIERRNAAAIGQCQLAMRFAAAEAGVFAYDGAWADVDDLDGLRREAEAARRLGYLGKSAIHPRQVAVINAVFRPSDAEIAHSQKVLLSADAAQATGTGAWMVDGRMIDAPFVVRARNTIALAKRLGLL